MSSDDRVAALALLLFAGMASSAQPEQGFKDGFETAPNCASSPGAPACLTVTVQTPAASIAPGEETSYCYYFRMPNVYAAGVRQFASTSSTSVLHASLQTTHDGAGQPLEVQPPGTLQAGICNWATGDFVAVQRVYWAQQPSDSVTMPSDDGSGTPVALSSTPSQPVALEMHVLNPTDQPVDASVALTITLLPPWIGFTRTNTYITYNYSIYIPPTTAAMWTDSCVAPNLAKFWRFSTHTHSFASSAELRNGASPIVYTSNWAAPAVATFGAPGFYQFLPTQKLTYSCNYYNYENFAVQAGDSYATEENCVAITYFFPATRSLLCINHTGPM